MTGLLKYWVAILAVYGAVMLIIQFAWWLGVRVFLGIPLR